MSMQTIVESIGFLLVGVCRAHRNHAAQLLAGVGIYVGQEWILLRLREHEGVTQSALAESCNVEGPTMSKALQRMEKAGLVSRKEDAIDARRSRIYLTDQGRALCDKVDALWAELEQRTTAGLSMEERVLLRRLLLQVRSNLE